MAKHIPLSNKKTKIGIRHFLGKPESMIKNLRTLSKI